MTQPHFESPQSHSAPFPFCTGKFLGFVDSAGAPWLAGFLSCVAASLVWGLHPIPIVPDEAAYLLQARLFSTFRWIGSPAPIPKFFEQMYIFVSPFTAAKYPPGFSLALVPGIWLGMPALVPILLAGVSGGLLFSLARGITDAPTAALAWLFWTSIPHDVWSMPPFLSQHFTTALCLASWWALQSWRGSNRPLHLILFALFLAVGLITRPLTMLAAGVPAAAAAVLIASRRRAWGSLAGAVAAALTILALIPIWNAKTTGNWQVTPLALHVRWYTPYDGLGFGWTPQEPLRRLPPDLRNVASVLSRERQRHTLARIPDLIIERARQIRANAFPRWRVALLPLLLIGLFVAPPEGLFAAGVAILIFLSYLTLAHPANLTAYYVETYPALSFLVAAGILRVARTRPVGTRFDGATAGALAFFLGVIPAAGDIYRYREAQRAIHARKARFESERRSAQMPSVIFVRYPPDTAVFDTLIENGPDFEKQRSWVVRDRGPKNAQLRAVAPERIPFLYVWSRDLLIRLDRPMSDQNRRIVEHVDLPE